MQVQKTTPALDTTKITNKGALLVESHVDEQRQAQANSLADSTQHKQFSVLSRWSELATISKTLAEYEQSERSLRQLYNQLQKLEQQISSQQVQKDNQQLALQVKQSTTLMSHVATRDNSGLDSQLQASSSANSTIIRQLPSKVDLLSPRPHDEKIQLMMGRSGKHVTIDLPAGQSPEQNINKLQQAFAPHQIQVKKSADQRLNFMADSSHAWPLKEPWIMTGEGVRIAAGNPMSLSLSEPAHSLDKLGQLSTENAGLEQYRNEIRQLQRRVQASLQKINQQRQQLQAELSLLQQPSVDTQSMLQLSQNMRKNMHAPEQTSVSMVVSQAKATRNLISFSFKSSL